MFRSASCRRCRLRPARDGSSAMCALCIPPESCRCPASLNSFRAWDTVGHRDRLLSRTGDRPRGMHTSRRHMPPEPGSSGHGTAVRRVGAHVDARPAAQRRAHGTRAYADNAGCGRRTGGRARGAVTRRRHHIDASTVALDERCDTRATATHTHVIGCTFRHVLVDDTVAVVIAAVASFAEWRRGAAADETRITAIVDGADHPRVQVFPGPHGGMQ